MSRLIKQKTRKRGKAIFIKNRSCLVFKMRRKIREKKKNSKTVKIEIRYPPW
jgi:hypothetical protein